jgi:heme o synthase
VKAFLDLTKFGIVCFVLFTGAAAYFLSQPTGQPIDVERFGLFLLSLYFLGSGIFALNQYQERLIDGKMARTQNRPLPSGLMVPGRVLIMSLVFIFLGLAMGLYLAHWLFFYLLATFILYNGIYTLYWKKKWAFGAVPGAIPGAMPILCGYGAHNSSGNTEAWYLFVLMFLWQMPHFWALALRYKDQYAAAGIPVLPVVIGDQKTLYHIGLYVFAYAAWAVAAPFFLSTWIGYLFVILPFTGKVVWEFLKYYKDPSKKHWLSFFLWTTFSVLVFVIIPVFDKWGELVFNRL